MGRDEDVADLLHPDGDGAVGSGEETVDPVGGLAAEAPRSAVPGGPSAQSVLPAHGAIDDGRLVTGRTDVGADGGGPERDAAGPATDAALAFRVAVAAGAEVLAGAGADAPVRASSEWNYLTALIAGNGAGPGLVVTAGADRPAGRRAGVDPAISAADRAWFGRRPPSDAGAAVAQSVAGGALQTPQLLTPGAHFEWPGPVVAARADGLTINVARSDAVPVASATRAGRCEEPAVAGRADPFAVAVGVDQRSRTSAERATGRGQPGDAGCDGGVDELGDHLGHPRPTGGQRFGMCDEVAGECSAGTGRGSDLSHQVPDRLRGHRRVACEEQPGHDGELVGSFGGELLGGSAPLVATADQHPGRATAACPTAVRAGPRAGRWRHWRRLRRHWRR